LLQGKKLIDEGHYAEAVPQLERAAALLPKNALAWDYLGLAYHGNGQVEAAVKAYRTALALDHKLAVVHYNLGCLYLEQTNQTGAIEELKSYTLLQPGEVEGWLKQGTALLRARRLDEAEKSFRTALDIRARHPEALNGLGLIQVQRRRWQEALNHFSVAALLDPPYAPAVLNTAIVQHQHLNNRVAALQRYRQYLALQPRPAEWETVEATVRQLELELYPPQIATRPAPVAVPAPTLPKTNALLSQSNATARVGPAVSSPPQTGKTRTNPPAVTVSPRPAVSPPPASTNVLMAAARPSSELPRPPAKTAVSKDTETLPAKTAVATSEPPANAPSAETSLRRKPEEIEVTRVQSDFVVKPPQDLSRAVAATAVEPSPMDRGGMNADGSTNAARRGFLSRLNPFGGKPKNPATAPPSEQAALPSTGPGVSRSGPGRYAYLSPHAPTAGDRVESEKMFKRGLKAQKGGNRAQAIAEYQAAVKTDPANYDAYYNLGLAALDDGEVRLSLWAYEIALALKPGAEDARYNFALALKVAGYSLDATEQLQKLLDESPSDARAHLSLANLYAQQLEQPHLAREHYLRVLELNPRHPEAAKIRYWLTTNP
jgi:Flp pilus assembly protein TadD